MLGLTREAVRAVRELTQAESADGLRIDAGPRPESADGLQIYSRAERFGRENAPAIQIEVAECPGVEETVLEAEGARLYLDDEALEVLDDKVLDADLSDDEPRFVVLQQADEPIKREPQIPAAQ